ncbi:hypothetical protein J2X36_005406 [Methylobacterium sp. BE186]|uniref:hypothetical protein n=1 Tax=Methylobacterium sp. BE186 TaxID=2817715 RepID=UPI002861AFDB|nr:hypothetical protein [Methylobacterium sp. BE186]MDR7040623.1 hypothetical protein [Methylobacterium sp. BE186]
MGHGGKRKGAGRPPILDEMQRYRIGLDCLRRFEKRALEKGKERERACNSGFDELDEIRAQYDNKLSRHLIYRLSKGEKPRGIEYQAIEQHLSAFEDIIDGKFVGSRLVIFNPIRHYAERTKILQEIAQEYSSFYSARITPRMVRKCAEEARALEETLREQQS